MEIRSSALLVALFLMPCAAAAQDVEPLPENQETTIAQNAVPPADPQIPEPKPKENPPEPESHGTRLRWQDIPRNLLHDQIAIFTSPAHINRSNAKWWLAFGGGTAALIATDQKFSNSLPQTTRFSTPSTWASRLGADYTLIPLWATFYVVGKVADKPRARDTARLGIEALLDSDITAGILKLSTQRPRPEIKGESVRFFNGGNAFPSGHSMKSFALARVAALEYSDNKIVPYVAYGLAATVSIARVGGRRHSPGDALAGAAMGFFIGDFVYRHHHAPSQNAKGVAWVAQHVTFSFGP